MIASRSRSVSAGEGVDSAIDKVVEELTNRLHSGMPIDIDHYVQQHPEHADLIRQVYSALEVMAELGRSSAAGGARSGSTLHGPGSPPSIDTLGDYRIIREVGRGGMGVVYEATQLSLDRRVALKVLPLAAALDPRQRQRFQVEAQAAAQLHHTHIVPVFAVGCERGVHYYAMQLIEGQSLAAVIGQMQRFAQQAAPDRAARAAGRGSDLAYQEHVPEAEAHPGPEGSVPTTTGPATENWPGLEALAALSAEGGSGARAGDRGSSSSFSNRNRAFFRTVARLGVQAADAIEHAHSLGVLHRDIKPANLIVDARGDLWVTDFGLARLQNQAGMTLTGDLLGTLRYMSPEQALAKRVVIDHRTDIYSLGVTIYELLTLRPAFQGRDRQELLRQIATEEPAPLRRLNPAIPRDLETIVLKAMAKEPESRYASAHDLADDLQRFLDDKPIRARRPGPLEQVAKWTRRHRPAVTTAVAVLIVTLSVGLALLWRQQKKTEAALLASEARLNDWREAMKLMLPASSALTLKAMAIVTEFHGPPTEQDKDKFFRDALKFYEGWARITKDRPEVREMEAEANNRLGLTRMLMRFPSADEAYQRSISLYEQVVADAPRERGPREKLAGVLHFRAMLRNASGGFAKAEPDLRRSLEIHRALVADFPDQAELYRSLIDNTLTFADFCSIQPNGGKARAEEARRNLESFLTAQAARAGQVPQARLPLAHACADLGEKLAGRGLRAEAADMYRQSLALEPRTTTALNNLAWLLVSDPAQTPFDPQEGVSLATRAVSADSASAAAWNTLGIARYRAGEWQAAIDALQKSIERSSGSTAADQLFMAMALWQLGKHDDARQWFEKATAAIRRDQVLSKDSELKRFQAEAASLIGEQKVREPSPG